MYVCGFQNHSIKPVHIMTKTLCLLAIVLSSLGMARCQNRSSDVGELTQKMAEVPTIALDSLEMQEVPGLTFFDQDDWKTMSIENGAVKMKKEFSYWGQIGEVDSIPFYRITFEMDGQSLTVDSLLGLGKPSLSKHSGKLVVPVVLKQYDSFIFDGKLVLIDFRGYRVSTIDVLTNSCAPACPAMYVTIVALATLICMPSICPPVRTNTLLFSQMRKEDIPPYFRWIGIRMGPSPCNIILISLMILRNIILAKRCNSNYNQSKKLVPIP